MSRGELRRMIAPGNRVLLGWLLVGLAGLALLPWYAIEDGFFSADWLAYYPADAEVGPALLQAAWFDRPWLWPILLFLLAPLAVLRREKSDFPSAQLLLFCGALGTLYVVFEGLAIGPLGWSFSCLEALFGHTEAKQYGMGAGALLVEIAFLAILSEGLARRGAIAANGFVVGALVMVAAGILVFVFVPVGVILLHGFETESGAYSLSLLLQNLASSKTWATAARSLVLALLAGAGSTILGLAFALVAVRTSVPLRRFFRVLTVLPIITPPFVIGLALILLFGRSGAATSLLQRALGIAPSRYIFGLPGILTAELLSFSPIAFLVLVGVVEGISPSLEEAAATLRADRGRIFRTVTLPLMRPGIAGAFLLCFTESLADFGNPLVLGGSYDVLSTEIYFAVAGAQNDVPRASALALVLLVFALLTFYAQKRWVGDRAYTTVTGKADSGAPAPLPQAVARSALLISVPWAVFTALVYLMVLFGGFVRVWGHDHSVTLAHYADMFSVSLERGLHFTGGAWASLLTTIEVAAVSAPLTALLGLSAAYLIARQRFFGRSAFELATMLSFAIPGTVIGVAYVLAFNAPPLELTGTGAILVLCFAFRNMPVGLRAGLAQLTQIDKSLDEASLTLGASSFRTVIEVVLPLLRPALFAALLYGFVRAMTAVSAVIFLVSANYDLATTYILGRVENGAYGPAVAYSSVLMVMMMGAIAALHVVIGQADLGRRGVGAGA